MRDELRRLIELVCALTGTSDRAATPASPESLARLRGRYPHVPSDLLDFYSIADGARLSDPWWEFDTVDDTLARAAVLDAMIGADFANWLDWWSKAWVPLGADASGNALCVDTAGLFGGAPGQVLIFMHDESARRIVAPSLGAYIERLLVATETGVICWEPDEGFWSEGNQERWDAFLSNQLPGHPIEGRARIAR
jgi:hypothetical protein